MSEKVASCLNPLGSQLIPVTSPSSSADRETIALLTVMRRLEQQRVGEFLQ